MTFLPISLNITAKKILFIGGGSVASHKLNVLKQFDADITILSIEFSKEIMQSPYRKVEKLYEKTD